jgi:two-component system OmpR family response regulator
MRHSSRKRTATLVSVGAAPAHGEGPTDTIVQSIRRHASDLIARMNPAIMNTPPSVASQQALLPHVLAIDDDPMNRRLIAGYLGENDLRVTTVPGERGVQSVLEEGVVDIVLLSLKVHMQDGMALARRLRDLSAIPLIIVTDRGEEADMVMGLEMGADDYLTRPSPRELLAHIRALLRRHRHELRQGRPEGVRAYRFDGLELNLNTRLLRSSDGWQLRLSNGEFHLLLVLLGAPERVLTRNQLLDLSRLHNDEVYDRSVDVQISRLRRKIEREPARPRYIRTERGAGYLFGVPVQTVY